MPVIPQLTPPSSLTKGVGQDYSCRHERFVTGACAENTILTPLPDKQSLSLRRPDNKEPVQNTHTHVPFFPLTTHKHVPSPNPSVAHHSLLRNLCGISLHATLDFYQVDRECQTPSTSATEQKDFGCVSPIPPVRKLGEGIPRTAIFSTIHFSRPLNTPLKLDKVKQ